VTLDLAAVRTYVQVPATALSDEDLTRMLESCSDDQTQRCSWPDVGSDGQPVERPATLDQALLRRVQREIAARNLPLGMVGLDASEYGPERLPYFDALVEEHERAYRRVVLS
jgi:hypothetical protein